MVNADDDSLESRPPTLEDLLHLCKELNAQEAKYIVIGGMAVLHHGFVRATEDIDFLIEGSSLNQDRVRKALMSLPDQAVKELRKNDLDDYVVVRIADEIVVDLLKEACGVPFSDAEKGIEWVTIQDVKIPFASAELLLRLKQSPREKDKIDRMFLKQLLKKK